MTPLAQAVHEYLAMRRALGSRLRTAGRVLLQFVAFLDAQGATHITIPLALQWAPATSSSRRTAALRAIPDSRARARASHGVEVCRRIAMVPDRSVRQRPVGAGRA